MGFPPIPERAPKSVQSRTFCAKSVQKVRFCTLLGALSGIGGNPAFCADATGVLERLVGHCLGVWGGMWFLNAVGTRSSPVSHALECAVPAFAWEKENGCVQVGIEAVVLTKLAPKRGLLIPLQC